MHQQSLFECDDAGKSKRYVFSGPEILIIRTRTNDQKKFVNTKNVVWRWEDGGVSFSFDWSENGQDSPSIEVAKGFLAYSLEKFAPMTAAGCGRMLRKLFRSTLAEAFPWSQSELLAFAASLSDKRVLVSFRQLYLWGVNQCIEGFSKENHLLLKEITSKTKNSPYDRIFLAQTGVSLEEEARLVSRINEESSIEHGWSAHQANIILQLCFELGPRAIQLHSLDVSDFEELITEDGERYYTIWLPMAKKRGQRRPLRRPRKVTKSLGDKLRLHSAFIKKQFDCDALFVSGRGKRLASTELIEILKMELTQAGVNLPGQVTMLLRHHLGQGLADQGAPLAVIAELLGHNSTVPARAYVSATPNIAQIKAKALGKSTIYRKIMNSLLTGKISAQDKFPIGRHVRGIVETQYVGDIGACALPAHTACPYNPVYACYTCKKFHPFADGRHEKVLAALQNESQKFIDAAERYGDGVQHNRAVTQHELTIRAVNETILRCADYLNESEKHE